MKNDFPFEIHPFRGAGEIMFGMSPSQVKDKIGPFDQTEKNYLKQRIEFRGFMNVAYTAEPNSELYHIGFGRQMEAITFNGINLFKDSHMDVVKGLLSFDSEPKVYLGFLVFLELGVALTGFHDKSDEDESKKAVSLFKRGEWDKRLEKMKSFNGY